MTNKTKTIIGIVGGVVVLGSVGAAMGGNDDNGTSSLSSSSSIVSTISSAPSSTISEVSTSSDVKQEEIPEPRETAIGKSDKSVDGIITIKATSVRNDKTGNWRYSAFSESGLNMSEYALSYYKQYFGSDKEIHAVVNFAYKSTTRISCTGGMLYVTVMEYVDGEEHDADLMFSGDIINDYIVYTDNGDIEDITIDEENPSTENSEQDPSTSSDTGNTSTQSSATAPEPAQSTTETAPSVETPSSTAPENHFNDYSNAEQQNTTEYVLNTSTFKIHFASCNDVKRIAAENYATTTDFDWAISNGYTSCGHCHAH